MAVVLQVVFILTSRYVIDNWQYAQTVCSSQLLERVVQYQQFDRTISQKSQPLKSNLIYHEFYMHKIYTTSVITNFFMLILLGLKKNVFIQYLYFLQLICDANGILVLLKFLTDKFLHLQQINDKQLSFVYKKCVQKLNFKTKVMLTVYSILNMLLSSCNNYPQKVKNFLFQYNSYLIIKKIPSLFFPSFKHQKNQIGSRKNSQIQIKNSQIQPKNSQIQIKNSQIQQKNPQLQAKKQNQMQGSLALLPSKEELDQLIKDVKNNEQNHQKQPLLIQQLTQTCYDLLKIQIPFFSKKMKDTNNMKMLVDIYCRFPKPVIPIKRTTLQKLLLKSRSKKCEPLSKLIVSVQQMKNMQSQYNNLYYWSNDFIQQSLDNQSLDNRSIYNRSINNKSINNKPMDNKSINNKSNPQQTIRISKKSQQIDGNFDYQGWLDDNVWKYYD